METEIKNVNLSFCCKEDWSKFKSITERSRFCGSCKHQVVDFTNATQHEFEEAIKSGNKICGRFKRSQMDDSFLKLAAASLVALASVASVGCGDDKNVSPQPAALENVEIKSNSIVMGMPIGYDKNDSTNSRSMPEIVLKSGKKVRIKLM